MFLQERGVVVVLRARERRKRERQNSPEKEKEGRVRFRRELGPEPIGDSPLRRNNKTATRRECTISMSANKKFPE